MRASEGGEWMGVGPRAGHSLARVSEKCKKASQRAVSRTSLAVH